MMKKNKNLLKAPNCPKCGTFMDKVVAWSCSKCGNKTKKK
jgi:ribosomal protein S27AE